MSDRTIGRWIVDFLGYLVALVATTVLISLVIKLDLLVQKLMTVVIYLVVGVVAYITAQYLRNHRWSRKHAKKVLGCEPMDWQRPSPFEQKLLQVGVILMIAGILSAITVSGSFESFIREVLSNIAGEF